MTGRGRLTGGLLIVQGNSTVYNPNKKHCRVYRFSLGWTSFRDKSFWCWRGLSLAKAYPHRKLTLQDQPNVIEQAYGASIIFVEVKCVAWLHRPHRSGIKTTQSLSRKVESTFYHLISSRKDLWETRTYIVCVLELALPRPFTHISQLTHVIHDWPDPESVKILQNIRQSMKPDSRVFIR